MKQRTALGLGFAASWLLLGSVLAAPPATVQAEIGYLLQHVEESGCDFNRNGIWYGGKRARAHLTLKYQYLVDHDQINTTNDFIDRAASKSSMTGISYQIRCNGGAPVDSSRWLLDALAAYRQSKPSPAAH
jgi:hypothetical protein